MNGMTRRLDEVISILFGGNVAEASRVSGIALHRILDGSVEPRLSTLAKLADTFGTNTAALLSQAPLVSDTRTSDDLPQWYRLLLNFNRQRQVRARQAIQQAAEKGNKTARALSQIDLLESPPILTLVQQEVGKNDQQILQEAVRQVGDAETRLIELAAGQLRKGS